MATNTTASVVELTTLLSTPTARLVYAIPLLIVSLLLTFAGTFLILDRTRSFPPNHGEIDTFVYSYESFEKKRKRKWCWWWRLEGGVGGLAAGFAFGAHLATLLALIVPNISTSAPLSSSAFLTVYSISAVLSSIIAGRYRVATTVFSGLASGVLTSMALSLMLHPPLIGRRVLLIILTIFISLPTILVGVTSPHMSDTQSNACLAYLPTLSHPLLRFCTASTGSFSLTMSISLLLKPPAKPWANVWERLWVEDGIGWGTAQEKGLVAAWVFFTGIGYLEDWALRKWLGENPDQKWDDYLSSYVQSLPYYSNRAGTFKPLPSFWDRLFHSHDNDFPSSFKASPDVDAKSTPLLTDDDLIPKTAIPDPFYDADTPPPASLFSKMGDKQKLKSRNGEPMKKSSHPLSQDDEKFPADNSDAPDDSMDEYDLPALVKKWRENPRFGNLYARLHNPDNDISSHRVDFKHYKNLGGLDRAQAKGYSGNSIRGGAMSGDTRETRSPSDNLPTTYMTRGRHNASYASTSNAVSSPTLVGSGSVNTRFSDHSSEAHTDRQVNRGEDTGDPDPEPTLTVPTPNAPDYSDYEVDLTSLAPTPLTAAQGGQDRKREQVKGDRTRVPRFMEQRMSMPSLLPASPTPTAAIASTAKPALASANLNPNSATAAMAGPGRGSTATDRARARVRAFVSGASIQVPGPTRRSSFPVSPSPPHSRPIMETQQQGKRTDSRAPITSGQGEGPLPPVLLPASVPATPSLLNALHRVAVAQQQAYGLQELPNITSRYQNGDRGGAVDGLPRAGNVRSGSQSQSPNQSPVSRNPQLRMDEPKQASDKDGAGTRGWDDFWKDVKAQAQTPIH
ncbi:hypothetical protein AX15_001716 [Amanita polypyramis BW_CC]|nr:hypothetical protein AX15_001716 [Amanita polypyramis BW_CC]